jgi:hypothetical protein
MVMVDYLVTQALTSEAFNSELAQTETWLSLWLVQTLFPGS